MQDRTISFAILTTAGLVAAVVAWQNGWLGSLGDQSHGAIAACEEAAQDGLASPSSYVRIAADYKEGPPIPFKERMDLVRKRERQKSLIAAQLTQAYAAKADREGPALAKRQARGERLTQEEKQLLHLWQATQNLREGDAARIAANAPKDRTGFVSLEFDADNRFGVAIRHSAACQFDALGEDGRYDKHSILEFAVMEGGAQ